MKKEEPSIALELEVNRYPQWFIVPFSVNHLDDWVCIKEQMVAEILYSMGCFS